MSTRKDFKSRRSLIKSEPWDDDNEGVLPGNCVGCTSVGIAPNVEVVTTDMNSGGR